MLEYIKKILILTTEPFPIGLAGTNRIICYGKGFLNLSLQPVIMCLKPTELNNNVFNKAVKGSYKGINFVYPGNETVRSESFLRRKINDIKALLYSMCMLSAFLKRKEVLFVIFYGNYFLAEVISIFLIKLFSIKIYKEESENPDIYFRTGNKWLVNGIKRYANKLMYRFYNGLLVMTSPLKSYFMTICIPGRKILLVPPTVDLERFFVHESNPQKYCENEYIAYIGSLKQKKDGVLTLIESFSAISHKFPDLRLLIAGDGTPEEKNELIQLCRRLRVCEYVQFIGRISSEEIPAFLVGAKVLVSCRPFSLQSDFGFPSKVLEYLASGIPTVTTATGELENHLKDRENAFVANMADSKSVEKKIAEVLQEYDLALTVAQNGRNMVKNQFNPTKQAKRIVDFNIG